MGISVRRWQKGSQTQQIISLKTATDRFVQVAIPQYANISNQDNVFGFQYDIYVLFQNKIGEILLSNPVHSGCCVWN